MQISDETVLSINKAIVVGVIAELVALEIKDNCYYDIKQRLNRLGVAGKNIQNYFSTHPNADSRLRETFRSEFFGGKMVIISEILTHLTQMTESGCESVLNSIEEAIKESPRENSETLLTP